MVGLDGLQLQCRLLDRLDTVINLDLQFPALSPDNSELPSVPAVIRTYAFLCSIV